MAARSAFDEELQALHIDLIKMGGLAEEAIDASIKAFRGHDRALAQTVVDGDRQVDVMEKEIEAKCLSLILKQQPVASDLRKISAALKMITDIERIGDNAADIAGLLLEITGDYLYGMARHIPDMADIAVKMVHDSITAFVKSDLELADRIIRTDDRVDDLFCRVKQDMAQALAEDRDTHGNAVELMMIAKYLERIADHAVNICEWVEFMETGKHKDTRIL